MNMQLMTARARMNHMAAPGPSGDPYWANVIALLHFDSGRSPSVLADATGRVWTNNSSLVTLDSTIKKFGASSAKFPNSSNYLSSPGGTGLDLGTGDFTIEAWTYFTGTVGGSRYLFDVGSNGIADGPNSNVSGKWAGYAGTISGSLYNNGPLPVPGVWQFATLERVTGVLTGYMDGVAWGSSPTSPNSTGMATRIGNYGGGGIGWIGNIAEFRITRGVARYKGNFTPPTAPFPDN